MQGKRYTEEQYRQKYNSSVFGIVLALVVEVCVFALCSFQGFTYLDPPPPEKSFIEVPELETLEAPVIKRKKGPEPAAEEVTPEKKIELVQKSEAPLVAQRPNTSKPATVGDKGDVEVPKVEREDEVIDQSMLDAFSNAMQQDDKAQVAKEATDALKAGVPDGNVTKGKTDGTAKSPVVGLDVDGIFYKPTYNLQKSGIIVIDVWVGEDGKVIPTGPNAPTLNPNSPSTDKELFERAKEAACKTRFKALPGEALNKYNKGTITYIFSIVE